MDNLFLALFFLSVVSLVVGLIKPSLFSRFLKGNVTRRNIFIIFGGGAFLFIFLLGLTGEKVEDEDVTIQQPTPTENSLVEASKNIYKSDDKALEIIIDDVNEIRMLDVRYAIDRTTNLQTSQYPFFAMKDLKSDGYIGILNTPNGKAVFLVSYIALNQSSYSDLIKSIKAVNGTAKSFDNNFQFAKGYDALEMIDLAETSVVQVKSDETEKPQQDEKKYYEVTKVVDGDTIDVAGERIRIIGINTPETVDPRKPVECFGTEASNKAKELLEGKKVYVEGDDTQDEIDKYGRTLGYVWTEDNLFFNLEMIKQGYAYEYTYNTPYKYQKEFKEAEQYAKDNKLGLWADGVCEVEEVVEAQEPTPEPEPTPTPEPEPEPTPAPQAQYDCSSNVYNCGDFSTHAEAQAVYEYCGGVNNDIHRLDRDLDGSACETLP